MTGVAVLLAAGIHLAGESIIDVIAGAASRSEKRWRSLTTDHGVELPGGGGALIGSGALRGAGNTRSRC